MEYTESKIRELLENKNTKPVEHIVEVKDRGIVYSSYFGKLDKIYDKDFLYLAICRFKPSYVEFKGNIIHLPSLSPSKELVLNAKKNGMNNVSFTHFFNIEINKYMLKEIDKLVSEVEKGTKICLLCYEKSEDFCHRHLLCKHLKEKHGITQIEL